MPVSVCRFCAAEFAAQRECVQHEIIFHQFDPNFTIKCGINNCPATFKVVSTYYGHRSRHHRTASKNAFPGLRDNGGGGNDEGFRGENEGLGAGNENFQVDGDDNNDNDNLFQDDEPMDVDNFPPDLPMKDICGNFLLYVRANSNMPLGVLSNTIRQVETIASASVANYAKILKESLVQQGIIPEDFELPKPSSSSVFEGLHTTYRQDQFFQESLNVIKPQLCALQMQQAAFSGASGITGNRDVQLKSPQMVYIPILETLRRLLHDESIVHLMAETEAGDGNEYRSFLDGKLFKNSQFFKDHPDALRIILYYDDVELCELLGSRSQAVGLLYMSLDNIPSKYRSKLQFIHLVAIAKKADIYASGIDTFLEPVVSDLKKLEKGIELLPQKTVYGCLIAFTGDNLASHSVGGFKEGFTARHPCRTCEAPLELVRKCIDVVKFLLRTEEAYQEQLRLLNAAPNQRLRSELSKEFGINREPLLNELECFSAIQNFPPDAMHDLPEGCFQITIKILLCKVINDRILTLEEINQGLRNFDYGYSEKKSKPAEIQPQHLDANGNLRQSASEMWQLAVILPLIIGPHMDINCDYWNVYLSLLQVSMLIMARRVSLDILGFLQVKLSEYADGFLNHYRDTLIPKQHFLLHYVHYIQLYGPISQFWNMRNEARHQFFKRLAKKMKNFKNISLSLANRNQLWEASQRFTQFCQFEIGMCGNGVPVASAECVYKDILPRSWDFVVEVPYIEVNNCRFVASECCVAIDFDLDTSLPIFAYLHAILMKNDKPILVCKEVQTVFFDPHLNAYLVEISDSFKMFQMKDLICSETVFHWHTVRGNKYIIVKRALGPLF